mmetsp:Transcript_3727/g.14616  ORF Transcript_3727/g.14616 Transcript_3727/m.14616 type:complete len:125 (-) Transcript_3727:574-948(-)
MGEDDVVLSDVHVDPCSFCAAPSLSGDDATPEAATAEKTWMTTFELVLDDDDDDDGFIQEDEEIRHPAASVVSSSSSSAQGPGGPSSAPARASLARGRKDDAGGGVGPAAVARDPRRRWSAVPA